MARQVNPPSKKGFWIGYAGGWCISTLLLLWLDPLGVWGRALYPLTCGLVCGELTARYRPQFWSPPDGRQ
jgi:hypothetical protein